MLVVLVLWIALFIVFFILGISVVQIMNRIRNHRDENDLKSDEYFFIGFITLSVITGILSVFVPVGTTLLWLSGGVTTFVLILNHKSILSALRDSLNQFTALNKSELILLFIICLFVLTAVVQKIIWPDTQSYHVQNIQWIRKYPVVPGLGNLHDRFAFNSMFFVISALFTFQVKNVLIFPLNGICYMVLIIKLIQLYSKEVEQGTIWKSVLYMLTILISLVCLIPNLNTPSPDIICAIAIMYVFVMVFEHYETSSGLSFNRFALLCFLIFTCITYKVSSLFLFITILIVFNKNLLQKILIAFCSGILIIIPFLLRNYYLSGYLLYPFPAIDIFNVDWKIPFANVIETKSVIEGWARIPVLSYTEVLNMKFTEWIFPWFKQLSFYSKLLVSVNLLSALTFLLMIFKKDFLSAKIQFVIFINLVFWFIEAPDPRFAYGFVFIGFSLTISYLIKLGEYSRMKVNLKLSQILLICFLLIILGRRIGFPAGTLKDPSLWLIPAPFETVETKDYSTNFHYRIPVNNQECFNTEIPCVTYTLNNVYLRGEKLSDGFRVINSK